MSDEFEGITIFNGLPIINEEDKKEAMRLATSWWYSPDGLKAIKESRLLRA